MRPSHGKGVRNSFLSSEVDEFLKCRDREEDFEVSTACHFCMKLPRVVFKRNDRCFVVHGVIRRFFPEIQS